MANIPVQRPPSELVTNDPAITTNPFYRYKNSGVSKLPTKKGNGDFASSARFTNSAKALSKKTAQFSPGKDNQIRG